jgi:hypothetical protein
MFDNNRNVRRMLGSLAPLRVVFPCRKSSGLSSAPMWMWNSSGKASDSTNPFRYFKTSPEIFRLAVM